MAILVSDSFNRTDNASTLGTTDSFAGGITKTWQMYQTSGSYGMGIKSNQAYRYSQSGSIDQQFAGFDLGVSDVSITVTFAAMITKPMLIMRATAANNYISLQSEGVGIGYSVYEYNGSTWTQKAAINGCANGDVFRVVLKGSSITGYKNGVQAFTCMSTFNQNATIFGINSTNSSGNTFDNFIVTDANTLASDRFNRANTTASTTGLGTTETGQTWIQQDGASTGATAQIVSSMAQINGDDRGMVIDCGSADYKLSVKFMTTDTNPELIFRADRVNKTYYMVEYQGGNSFQLYEYNSGWSTRATKTMSLAVGSTITVEAVGSTINVYVNEVLQYTYTGATLNQTSTYVGVGSGNGVSQFDDFLVESLAPPTVGTVYTKTLVDAMSFLDSITKRSIKSVLLIDVVSPKATISKKLSAYRALADAIPAKDSIYKLTGRSLSDSAAFSDTTSRQAAKSIYDSIATSESAPSQIAARNTVDLVKATDMLFNQMTLFRSTSDSVSIADTVAKQVATVKLLTDSVEVKDTLLRGNNISISLNDSLNVTDIMFKQLTAFRNVADSVVTIDTVTKQVSAFRSVSDSVATTDNVTKKLSAFRNVLDSVYVADTIAKQFTAVRSVTDSISITDTVSKKLTAFKSITDSVSTTDSLAKQATITRSLTDSVKVTDNLVRGNNTAVVLNDTINVTDTLFKQLTSFRGLVDSVKITDVALIGNLIAILLTDFISSRDLIFKDMQLTKADFIKGSDSTGKAMSQLKTDSMKLGESTAKKAAMLKADGMSSSDNISRGIGKAVTDNIPMTEGAKETDAVKSVSDSLKSTDTVQKVIRQFIGLLDSVSTGESFQQDSGQAKHLSDTITLSDSIFKQMSRLYTDGIKPVDTKSQEVAKIIIDSLDPQDSIAIAKIKLISLLDSMGTTDEVTFEKGKYYVKYQTIAADCSIDRTINVDCLLDRVINAEVSITSVIDGNLFL